MSPKRSYRTFQLRVFLMVVSLCLTSALLGGASVHAQDKPMASRVDLVEYQNEVSIKDREDIHAQLKAHGDRLGDIEERQKFFEGAGWMLGLLGVVNVLNLFLSLNTKLRFQVTPASPAQP